MRGVCAGSVHLYIAHNHHGMRWIEIYIVWCDIAGPPDKSSRNSGNKCQLVRPLTVPNFVTFRQEMCEICWRKFVLPENWTKLHQNSSRPATHQHVACRTWLWYLQQIYPLWPLVEKKCQENSSFTFLNTSCLHHDHLLPDPRDHSVISRLRTYEKILECSPALNVTAPLFSMR